MSLLMRCKIKKSDTTLSFNQSTINKTHSQIRQMKIRTITIGFLLTPSDIVSAINPSTIDLSNLKGKLAQLWKSMKAISNEIEKSYGFIIQTLRLSFNSFEEWLIPVLESSPSLTVEDIIMQLDRLFEELDIGLVS